MSARGWGAALAILGVACARVVFAAGDALAGAPPPGSPAPIRVAVTPSLVEDDLVVVEALNRMRFELTDVGFAAPDPDARQPADFIVGLARAGDELVVSVTAVRPTTGNALLRSFVLADARSRSAGADQASTIAIRAVEVLRATILQAPVHSTPASAPGRAPPPITTVAPLRWAVGIGAAVLQSFHGFGTGWGPSAHVAMRANDRFGIEIAAALPLSQPDLEAPDGSVTIRQQTLAAGARYSFRAPNRVRPSVSVSGGVYHLSADGHARVGQATSPALTTPFLATALGLMLTRGGAYALQLQAQLLFVKTAPFVTIGVADAGHAGWPLALLTLELEWSSGFRAAALR